MPMIVQRKPPEESPYVFKPSAIPGCRAPHTWLSQNHRANGSALFDHFGKGFTLLQIGNLVTQDLERDARNMGIPLKIIEAPLELVDLLKFPFTLIRPDQYVCWRGETLPEKTILQIVTGN